MRNLVIRRSPEHFLRQVALDLLYFRMRKNTPPALIVRHYVTIRIITPVGKRWSDYLENGPFVTDNFMADREPWDFGEREPL